MTILGIMSGTSLDGLDLALCRFKKEDEGYTYKILKTGFEAYPEHIRLELDQAAHDSGINLIRKHKKYGRMIGRIAKSFLQDTEKADYIASHGHTIFHEPENQLTFQLGDGASIAAEAECSVISDFRNLDTALKGQGAPLVPIGDKYLFSQYDFCLNLGGFSNISHELKGNRVAYDICPVNIVLNALANEYGSSFDKDGEIGGNGKLNKDLLNELNTIPYYFDSAPKSLGREYAEKHHFRILKSYNIPVQNKLRTYYKHIAEQISTSIKAYSRGKILITGGGAHNSFLINELKTHTNHSISLADNQIIDYKEAIIFAFLGFLRILNEVNVLSTVTGAKFDSKCGSVISF